MMLFALSSNHFLGADEDGLAKEAGPFSSLPLPMVTLR